VGEADTPLPCGPIDLHISPASVTHLGLRWVKYNGPDGTAMGKGKLDGHVVEVSPRKCVLLRTVPQLPSRLEQVVNAADPWVHDRGEC
jgi:hypothetical protein